MATVKRQNVCFGVKYTDNAGQEKTRWVNVGKAFHSDRGGISIKFDTMPAGAWDGWVQLFDEKDSNQGPQGYNRQGSGPIGYGQQGPVSAGQGFPAAPAPYGRQGGIQPNEQFAQGGSAQSAAYTIPAADDGVMPF